MTQASFESSDFPRHPKPVRAFWAPILLEPVMGSVERFVIGVAAVSKDGFHVEGANALRRLECLYGRSAETAIFGAQLALDELRNDIASRGLKALRKPKPILTGLTIGDISEGEAPSIKEIARNWMAQLSSLYKSSELALEEASIAEAAPREQAGITGDRLPHLVMDYVVQQRPGLVKFFSKDIQEQRERRRYRKTHNVIIDFTGSHLVANFGTLFVAHRATSVDRIKRRLWDLKIDRDRQRDSLISRYHEMIVQHPPRNDPQITEKQMENIQEALDALQEQAVQEELKFRSLTSVGEIGDHLLSIEAGRA